MTDNNQLLDEIFNTPSLVRREDDAFEIFDGYQWRQIPLGECRSNASIVACLLHYLDTNWFTTQHIGQFIRAVYHQFPELDERK